MRKLIDSHGGLLRLLSSVLSLPWTGATWALDGNGRAYNTPTLGSELLTNGGFDSDTDWSKGTGWSIGSGVATKASGAVSEIWQTVGVIGAWTQVAWTLTHTAGLWRLRFGSGVTGADRTASGTWTETNRQGSSTVLGATGAFSSSTGSVDNLSAKLLVLSTLPATVVGAAGQTVTAKPYAITTGTQAGVISHLDDAASPANFIIAYHNGASAIMDKCVGGTYTNLVTATVSFVSDAAIEIRSLGSNQFDCYYNGSKQGNTATVSDAGIISNTRYGLFSTYSGNTFSEFTLGGAVVALALPGA